MVLVTTPGATNANSLASLLEAEDYMGMVTFKDDWGTAGDPQKEAALRQASELMEQLPWKGVRTTETQALCWPRRGGFGLHDPQMINLVALLYDRDGYAVPADTIPRQVRHACCEFAFRLLSEDRQADAGALSPAELKVGSISLVGLTRRPIPPSVLEKVRQFLTTDGISVKLVRG